MPSLTDTACSSVLQLFEEVQELLTHDAEDQTPSQAPGLRQRAASRTQGEALRRAPLEDHVAQLSVSSVTGLLCLSNVLNDKEDVECWRKGGGASLFVCDLSTPHQL